VVSASCPNFRLARGLARVSRRRGAAALVCRQCGRRGARAVKQASGSIQIARKASFFNRS
ncbi:hypothetical protein M885DRAFT_535866, partial [Pelagophyceae sp. CCMP2097]